MTLSNDELAEARYWISDCQWTDLDDVDDLTDAQVERGIKRHYSGGIEGFRNDL